MPDRTPGLRRLFSTSKDRPDGPDGPDRTHTASLKAVVHKELQLTDEHTVVLRQLDCTEPDCPPVETVIAVLSPNTPTRQWKLHKPLAATTADDVRTTLTTPPHGAHQ